MASRIYAVDVPGIGRISKVAQNIAAARAWADGAFGRRVATVSVPASGKRCGGCDSKPCCCQERKP